MKTSALLLLTAAASAQATCTKQYTVVSGDSCDAIAQELSVSSFQLTKLNPGLDCSNLQVGEVLCITDSDYNCQPVYTIESGDSCFAIAQQFGITVDELINDNPQVGSDCNIFVGDVLCVQGSGTTPTTTSTGPTSTPTPPTATCTKAYSVVSGDSCDAIASSQGISSYELTLINPSLDCSNLSVGQVLCVQDSTYSCQPVYTVQSGDSCFAIANANGITVDQVLSDNPQLGSDCALFVGESLCIANQ